MCLYSMLCGKGDSKRNSAFNMKNSCDFLVRVTHPIFIEWETEVTDIQRLIENRVYFAKYLTRRPAHS